MNASPHDAPLLTWTDGGGAPQQARWRASTPPPKRLVSADANWSAERALRAVSEGAGLVWQGDFHQARQLLQALERRLQRGSSRRAAPPGDDPAQAFHLHRKAQAERARRLGLLLLPFAPGHHLPLPRAPQGDEARAAAGAALGDDAPEPYLASLRDFQGWMGAWQWRLKGVPVPALGQDPATGEALRVHPHHGVFSPVRGEYLDLVAQTPLPGTDPARLCALDIGTGTGVLAALLARRGVGRVLATELHPRALANAADTFARLGLAARIELLAADLFPPPAACPPGGFDLIVCNPPWVPAKVHSALDAAVYDPDSRMLRGVLAGLRERLAPHGQAWIALSDLAEHLGLRPRHALLAWIESAGLRVLATPSVPPRHAKAFDPTDALHAARRQERTVLWCLGR